MEKTQAQLDLLNALTPRHAKRTMRSEILLGDMFVNEDGLIDGDAKGWAFFVDPRFIRCLDIQKTSIANGDLQWTQGSAFCFDTGVTLYDSPDGYRPWLEAMKSVRRVVQIVWGIPAIPAMHVQQKWEKGSSNEEQARETEESLQVQGYKTDLQYNRNARRWFWTLHADFPRQPGHVEFNIFSPNESQTKLGPPRLLSMSQDAFVRFLITGEEAQA